MKRSVQHAIVLALLLAVAGHGQRPPLRIAGRVLRADTGDPVAGARVTAFYETLRTANDMTGYSNHLFRQKLENLTVLDGTTETDSEGRFILSNLQNNSYWVVAAANGYTREGLGVFADTSGSVLLRLTPTAALSGIIRDRNLRPATDISVELLRFQYDKKGSRTLTPVIATRTNDLGEYRFYHLTPGSYYVRAGTLAFEVRDPLRDMLDPAFYPGVEDINQAQLVEIRPGEDKSAVDLNLKAGQTYRVQGAIVDPTGHMKDVGRLVLSAPSGSYGSATDIDVTGGFTFDKVVSGTYVFRALGGMGSGRSGYFGHLAPQLVVTDRDIENLTLNIAPSFTIAARVRVEGKALSNASFRLSPARPECECIGDDLNSDTFRNAVMSDAGNLTFKDVRPGEYRISLQSPSQGYYLKEASLRGIDASKNPLPLSPTNDAIEIVLSSRVGKIDGVVTDSLLRPSPGTMTVLIPERDRNQPDRYRIIMTDALGRFVFPDVAPGDYRILAWKSIEPYAWFDPEVIRKVEINSEFVHVDGSSEIHATVRRIETQ